MLKFQNSKLTGFTLAEVLITLAIIGVVAALTMPAVVNSYRRLTTEVKLKKFYSIFTDAIRRSEIDNGPSLEWTYNELSSYGSVADIAKDKNYGLDFFQKYLAPYLKHVEVVNTTYDEESGSIINEFPYVVLADGSVIYINRGACIDFYYDTNGEKAPNEFGVDRFNYMICTERNIASYTDGRVSNFFPYGVNWCTSIARCRSLCISEGKRCTAYLEKLDWKIPKDYPHKLR